ncbi:WD40 repeat-like protein [Rhizodiscina lignyota]|uniref:WD40 repeat-like protein n=1 Tax=Rhizodiscina lignyota TaxID=1504668 RepID=A0A9P4MAU9_9PEZI|nr:WD40 repeat-like protein [Rhizodiscina lignyota]
MPGQSPFRLDEGYSEDTRSQSGASDVAFRGDSNMDDVMDQDTDSILPEWLMVMTEEQRSEFAYIVLRSLRTSSIAAIVDRLNPLLHIDPVLRLPPEIMFDVLRYLDPPTLLRVSTLSKTWRSRATDSRLWRKLFGSEGWVPDIRRIRTYEAAEKARSRGSKERKMRLRPSVTDIDRHISKKRAGERRLFGEGGSSQEAEDSNHGWAEQSDQVEADDSPMSGAEDRMQDIAFDTPASPPTGDEPMSASTPLPTFDQLQPPVKPTLLTAEPGEDAKVNWQYLYKQKRRLEENWNTGKFKNFQLPHPAHPDEAHGECVYTIQYSATHLVSGSRDHTIRIWDLDTQRLTHVLRGHDASVLCLQFDERPEHDLVASGGSDCHVLLWRFSTGQLIHKLEKAHTESVLNLRFDDRFLITCSKDKTIKVWNRRQLLPGDQDYPAPVSTSARFPSYIVNAEDVINSQTLHSIKPLKPFSLLMTLHGHTAAVNAIQVLDGQIVSASGDRTVKVWDVKTGHCLKTITGHLKGIACVQYDGRRIVSGSSDDSVRIFDRVTGAEVALLRGHSNLVRTVQARFGDFPGNEEELEAEAREIDRQYFQAQLDGSVPATLTREERHARNNGSSNPRDIQAWGAKIPPGGGGSRWARIVSGSYDETVIIWRKNHEGRWLPLHRLNQWEAVLAAGGRPRTFPAHGQQGNQQAGTNGAQAGNAQNHAGAQGQPAHPANPALAHALVQQAQMQIAQAHNTIAHAHQVVNQQGANAHANPGSNVPAAGSSTSSMAAVASSSSSTAQQTGAGTASPNPGAVHVHHHHHHHHHAAAVQAGTNSRVFKLQFDARRIICCSQDPTIVGWDFANGDEDIMSASRFFGEEM